MSSLRNAVKRITHKERSQPKSRSHLGILEKKKDYKQRANHFHKRENKIKHLQRKASMRNPDEFYFGMNNSQIINGQHKKNHNVIQKELEDQIGPDAVRIMKDQDLSYIRMQKQKDISKAQKLQNSLHYLDTTSTTSTSTTSTKKKTTISSKSKHTIFVNTKQEAKEFDVVKHFDTVPELADRTFNRPRVSKLRKMALEQVGIVGSTTTGVNLDDPYYKDDNDDTDEQYHQLTARQLKVQEQVNKKIAKEAAKARLASYHEMEARKQRAATMELVEANLITEKNLTLKGRKRKIQPAQDGKPAQYKWRRKRNR